MAGTAGAAKKAAARVVKGGGTPAADVEAAVTVARERSADRKRDKVARERAREHGAGPEPKRKTDANGDAVFRGERKGGGKGSSSGVQVKSFNWLGGRKVLTAQYVLVIVVVGLGALLSGDESKDDVVLKALIKSSALSLLFFLLALLSAGGKGPAKAANAFATLITATYVFTSSDVHAILNWFTSFFGHEHKPSDSTGSPVNDFIDQSAQQALNDYKSVATGSSQLVNTGELLGES
ncbi:MAG: hypothetical protein HOY76_18620 [Streptomyces sp.]|nr:hypothetical protein [Streptomyces sp.]